MSWRELPQYLKDIAARVNRGLLLGGTLAQRAENAAAIILVSLGIALIVLMIVKAPYSMRDAVGTALFIALLAWLAMWSLLSPRS